MSLNHVLQIRISKQMDDRIRKAIKGKWMNRTEFIREAINEKLGRESCRR